MEAGGNMKRLSKALKVAMVVAGTTVLAAGCGSARTANKENLAWALNNDYSANQDCLFAKPMPFPYEVALNDKLLQETRHKLDALSDAGLLERDQTIQSGSPVNRYMLTAAGASAEGKGRFCYGKRKVTSIEKFTPPVDHDGMPVTKVEYHFVMKNPPSWAKQEPVIEAFPSVAKSMASEPVDEATLVLTSNGWELTY